MHMLADLSSADRTAFRLLLRRVATRVNSLDPAAGACEMAGETSVGGAPAERERSRHRR